jgi:hypothetical protein
MIPMNSAKLSILLIWAFAFLALTGCKSTGKHVRWYDGAAMSADKISLLKVPREFDLWKTSPILTVDKIDGRPLVTNSFVGNIASEIELLPGSHELFVSYWDGNYKSTADSQIKFFAEPGDIYELHGAQRERGFSKELFQSLTFQRWYWTCWIVDAKTGKVVAGTPRTTPFKWYE